jgi:hypothetical protein
MDDDAIPPGITGNLRIRIHAGLLRVDAEWQTNPVSAVVALRSAFDAFARELLAAGRPLTDAMLSEITAAVCKWGRAHNWLNKVAAQAGGQPPIPVPFAESLKYVRAHLKGPISHWRAEALLAGIGVKPEGGHQSALEQLKRAQARHGVEYIIQKAGIGHSTFYRWKADPHAVKPDNAEAIHTVLRKLSQ